MAIESTVECPFCGSENSLVLDDNIESQRFTTDCENCCRPFEVQAEVEDGELTQLNVSG